MKKGFKLQNVKWLYATVEENQDIRVLIPYVINKDKTKIKLLENGSVINLKKDCNFFQTFDFYCSERYKFMSWNEHLKEIKTYNSEELINVFANDYKHFPSKLQRKFLQKNQRTGELEYDVFHTDFICKSYILEENQIVKLGKHFEKALIRQEHKPAKNNKIPEEIIEDLNF